MYILKSKLFLTLKNYIKYRKETPPKPTEHPMVTHIEGSVLAPIIVNLSREGCFDNIKNRHLKWWLKINRDWQSVIKELFTCTKLTKENNQITE